MLDRFLPNTFARLKAIRCDRTAALHDERGAIFAEYATVMVCVSLLVALAIGALGIPLFNLYAYAETVIRMPFP